MPEKFDSRGTPENKKAEQVVALKGESLPACKSDIETGKDFFERLPEKGVTYDYYRANLPHKNYPNSEKPEMEDVFSLGNAVITPNLDKKGLMAKLETERQLLKEGVKNTWVGVAIVARPEGSDRANDYKEGRYIFKGIIEDIL
ncbi:MAG: hypothetical protein PHU56_03560 [Candidatus Pacebacteria bacterium]|nr:hypothetical protein [Candidatus Paceibacterota bacterium]